MPKAKIIVALAWQVGACDVANLQLEDDLQDLAAQVGTRIGLDPVSSDEDLRASPIPATMRLPISPPTTLPV